MRTLWVVSGGDAPGINTLLGQYTLLATSKGDAVSGAQGGFPGIPAGEVSLLTYPQLVPWMGRGGSILPSSRDPALSQADAGERIRSGLQSQGVDNDFLFGGKGTLRYVPINGLDL